VRYWSKIVIVTYSALFGTHIGVELVGILLRSLAPEK